MTELAPAPAGVRTAADTAPAVSEVGLGELGLLAVVTAVAVIGWISLALAHVGLHDGRLAVIAGLAATVAAGWLGLQFHRCRVRVSAGEILPIVAVAVLGAVWFLPGFPYAFADKDPGAYVIHGQAIADEGNVEFVDPVVRAAGDLPGAQPAQFGRFPGLWEAPGDSTQVLPQFFHYLPALNATAIDLGGLRAAFHLTPLLGALALACLFGACRRAFGVVVAVIATILLATNMLELWQARFPTTEIAAQMLLLGALFAVSIGLESRWRPALAAGGVLCGLGFLVRADGILLLAIAGGLIALAYALGRFTWAARWFLAGLVLTLPHAAYQAWSRNAAYAEMNSVPSFVATAAFVAVLAVAALLVRRYLAPPVERWWTGLRASTRRRAILAAGAIVTMLAAAFFVLCAYRDRIGQTVATFGTTTVRLYDEVNIDRLSWFVTGTAFVLVLVGMALFAWRQPPRLSPWLVVLPGLALLPVYLWEARVSPRLMWWGRRYVPSVLPVIFILAAVVVGALLAVRGRRAWIGWLAGALVLGYLVQFQVRQSWPLREHREMAGTATFAESVADLTPPDPGTSDSVLIWDVPDPGDVFHDPSRNFAGSVWLLGDRPAVVLREPLTEDLLDAYRERFPDASLYYVSKRGGIPADVDPTGLTPPVELASTTPIWEETYDERPKDATSFATHLYIWRVLPDT